MVVVIIIGLLAAVIVPSVIGKVANPRCQGAPGHPGDLHGADDVPPGDFRYSSTTSQGLKALIQQPADPTIRNWRKSGYIQDGSLKDPWGNDYQYVYPGTCMGTSTTCTLYGADGQEGGEGEDADVGNWNLDATPGSTQNGNGR